MKLADEIRAMYKKPHYTFEEVTEEIRKHVKETYYKEIGKRNFSSFQGFNVSFSDDVPKMKWECGMDIDCLELPVDCLKIPDGSVDFEMRKIKVWFKEQGFTYCGPYKGWRIKF